MPIQLNSIDELATLSFDDPRWDRLGPLVSRLSTSIRRVTHQPSIVLDNDDVPPVVRLRDLAQAMRRSSTGAAATAVTGDVFVATHLRSLQAALRD